MKKLLMHKITEDMSNMTSSERKVARSLLADYPSSGLMAIAKLASQSGVSGPTVLRFVKRLGFNGYQQFQDQLLSELSDRKSSFLELYDKRITGLKDHKLIDRFTKVHLNKLELSLTRLPIAEFDETIKLLSDLKFRVICVGGRYTDFVARLFASNLHELRSNIRFSENSSYWRHELLPDINRKDVIVVFDTRRYQQDTVDFAKKASEQGAKIILITDPYLSPIASVASFVLPVEVEGISAFDSTINIMAVVDLLIAGVVENLGEQARDRMSCLESVRLPFEYTDDET